MAWLSRISKGSVSLAAFYSKSFRVSGSGSSILLHPEARDPRTSFLSLLWLLISCMVLQ